MSPLSLVSAGRHRASNSELWGTLVGFSCPILRRLLVIGGIGVSFFTSAAGRIRATRMIPGTAGDAGMMRRCTSFRWYGKHRCQCARARARTHTPPGSSRPSPRAHRAPLTAHTARQAAKTKDQLKDKVKAGRICMQELKEMGLLQEEFGGFTVLPTLTICKAQICNIVFQQAMALESHGNLMEAAGLLQRLVAYNGDYMYARLGWAWVLLKLGRKDPSSLRRALAVLNKAVQTDPDHPGAYALSAVAHCRRGENRAALASLGAYAARQPQLWRSAEAGPSPTVALMYLLRGEIKRALADGDAAAVADAAADADVALRLDADGAQYVGKGLADDGHVWALLTRYVDLLPPALAHCLDGLPPDEADPDSVSRLEALTDFVRLFAGAPPAEEDDGDALQIGDLPAQLGAAEAVFWDELRMSSGGAEPTGEGAGQSPDQTAQVDAPGAAAVRSSSAGAGDRMALAVTEARAEDDPRFTYSQGRRLTILERRLSRSSFFAPSVSRPGTVPPPAPSDSSGG